MQGSLTLTLIYFNYPQAHILYRFKIRWWNC